MQLYNLISRRIGCHEQTSINVLNYCKTIQTFHLIENNGLSVINTFPGCQLTQKTGISYYIVFIIVSDDRMRNGKLYSIDKVVFFFQTVNCNDTLKMSFNLHYMIEKSVDRMILSCGDVVYFLIYNFSFSFFYKYFSKLHNIISIEKRSYAGSIPLFPRFDHHCIIP